MITVPTFLLLTLTLNFALQPCISKSQCLCRVKSYLSKTELVITFKLSLLPTCTISLCSKAIHLDTRLATSGLAFMFLSFLPMYVFHQYLLRTASGPGFMLRAGKTDVEAALVFQSSDTFFLKVSFGSSFSYRHSPH